MEQQEEKKQVEAPQYDLSDDDTGFDDAPALARFKPAEEEAPARKLQLKQMSTVPPRKRGRPALPREPWQPPQLTKRQRKMQNEVVRPLRLIAGRTPEVIAANFDLLLNHGYKASLAKQVVLSEAFDHPDPHEEPEPDDLSDALPSRSKK